MNWNNELLKKGIILALTLFTFSLSGGDASSLISHDRVHPPEWLGNSPLPPLSAANHDVTFQVGSIALTNHLRSVQIQFINSNKVSPTRTSPRTSKEMGANQIIRYPNLWNGIDLIFQHQKQTLTSIYHLEPGADPGHIGLRINHPLEIAQDGSLAINVKDGILSFSAPIAYQYKDGRKIPVDVQFHQTSPYSVGFKVGNYDPYLPLTIDPTLEWEQLIGSPGETNGQAIAVDDNQNAYIVGTSSSGWGSPISNHQGKRDSFLLKLDPDGEQEWVSFFGSPDNDTGYDIALNEDGAVFLIGTSNAAWGEPIRAFSGESDIFLAKFDQDGTLVWHTFFGSQGLDRGTSLDLDGQGNIYLTGHSQTSWGEPLSDGNDAVIVAKVGSQGHLVWHAFFGSWEGYDTGESVQATNDNSIFVTGFSASSWGNPIDEYHGGGDGILLKLDSTGQLVWHTFLGSASYDYGTSLVVSRDNDIFLVGNSDNSWGSPLHEYQEKQDVYISRITSNGKQSWVTFLGSSWNDGGTSIVLDQNDDLLISGYSHQSWHTPLNRQHRKGDYFTAKFNRFGQRKWVTFQGSVDFDHCQDMAVDGSGNIYLTGFSLQSWGNPIQLHSGKHTRNGFAAKLDHEGSVTWNTFFGSANAESVTGLITDRDGNIIIIGHSSAAWGNPIRGTQGESDTFVAKFTPAGKLLWNTFLGSQDIDYGQDITVDISGNIYVTGRSNKTWGTPLTPHAGSADAYLAKLTSQGKLAWVTFLGSKGFDTGKALSLGDQGDIYLLGYSNQIWGKPVHAHIGDFDTFVAKLSSDGTLSWHTFLGSMESDYGYDIQVGQDNSVYVCGTSRDTWGNPLRAYTKDMTDAYIAKLNPAGHLEWNTFLGSWKSDGCSSLLLKRQGQLLITGTSGAGWGKPIEGHHGLEDGFLASLEGNGELLWHTFIGSSGSDFGKAIATDDQGNIYVSGSSDQNWGTPIQSHSGGADNYLLMVDDDGNRIWNTYINNEGVEGINTILVTANGQILIAGSNRPFRDLRSTHSPLQSYLASFSPAPEISIFTYQQTDAGPEMVTMPSQNLSFDSVPVGYGESRRKLELVNIGSKELHLTGSPVTKIQGMHEQDFSISSHPDESIHLGGGSTSLELLFQPSESGYRSALLKIPNDDPDEDPLTIHLVGTGTLSFMDVPSTHWAYRYIDALHNTKVTFGCGDGNFCPTRKVTRAEIAVFIGKAAFGANYQPPDPEEVFRDVPEDHWAAKWIELLVSEGITSGCNRYQYCPNQPVTRSQLAVLLLKAQKGAAYKPPQPEGIFRDVPVDHWAAPWIERLAAEGISDGCKDNNFCPNQHLTRDQAAVLLTRTFDLPLP